jgi:hypothetical protein
LKTNLSRGGPETGEYCEFAPVRAAASIKTTNFCISAQFMPPDAFDKAAHSGYSLAKSRDKPPKQESDGHVVRLRAVRDMETT